MKKIHYTLIIASITGSTLLHAQGDSVPADDTINLFDLIMQGGWAMIPLAITCAAMFFLVFYCYSQTSMKKFIPQALIPKLQQDLNHRDIPAANLTLTGAGPSVLTRCITVALTKARPDWPDSNKEKMETLLFDSLEAEDSAISAWINYLNVVAAIAPMIGLLGTVSGMIGAFQTIGIEGMGDPSKLAGDIGQALITTATGLCIGIPAMVFYFFFKNRLTARMTATVQAASTLIDYLAGEYWHDGEETATEKPEQK